MIDDEDQKALDRYTNKICSWMRPGLDEPDRRRAVLDVLVLAYKRGRVSVGRDLEYYGIKPERRQWWQS